MLLVPSLQAEYGIVYSGDPALNLPADETERAHALQVARETGNWSPLVFSGQQPTIFWLRPIHGAARTRLVGEIRRGNLSTDETLELAFRYALARLENAGDIKPRFALVDGLPLLSLETVDQVYSVGGELNRDAGREIVHEIGGYAIERASAGIAPRS